MDASLVYTTDPEKARNLRQSSPMPEQPDAAPGSQSIRIALDRKRRAGKTVTVASGFKLTAASLEALARSLRKRCGAGGTETGAVIEIQGDHVATVSAELERLGYRVKRVPAP